MIRIYRDGYKLDIEGHAGYGAYGSDIVCAGVSILFHARARTLRARRVTGYEYKASAENELKRVACAPTEAEQGAVDVVYETIMHGIAALSVTYPEYVKICEVRHEVDQR